MHSVQCTQLLSTQQSGLVTALLLTPFPGLKQMASRATTHLLAIDNIPLQYGAVYTMHTCAQGD